MKNKRENVRHWVGLRFAGNFFLPGMIVVGLLMMVSIFTLVATNGRSGGAFLELSMLMFPLVVLIAVSAYAAARRNPRLAHSEIAAFIERQESIIDDSQESIIRLKEAFAQVDQKELETISTIWNKHFDDLRQKYLAWLHQDLSEMEYIDDHASNEFRIRNQSFFIEMYRLMREHEELIKLCEALQIPEMSKEEFEKVKAITAAVYESSRAMFKQHVEQFQVDLHNAQLSLEEAHQLL